MDEILEHLQHVLSPAEFVEVQEHWHEKSELVEDWPKRWTNFHIAQPINFN